MRYVLELKKANPVQTEDGILTERGLSIAHDYAVDWLQARRNLELERENPELQGLFFDIRSDPELARTHAQE